eukprot:6175166-Pleurochrysis_carterae.AAC.6
MDVSFCVTGQPGYVSGGYQYSGQRVGAIALADEAVQMLLVTTRPGWNWCRVPSMVTLDRRGGDLVSTGYTRPA